jgi:hypothetical protein
MPKPIVLRPLTDKERETLEKIAKSQTAPARQVERAKAVLLAHRKMRPVDIAEKLDRTHATIYRRLGSSTKSDWRAWTINLEREGQPPTPSGRVEHPHERRNRAVHVDPGVPLQEGDAPSMGLFPEPPGLHHDDVQPAGPVGRHPGR